jgi:hypothetical protein
MMVLHDICHCTFFIAAINYQVIYKLTTILMIYKKLNIWLKSEKGTLFIPLKES